jgi:hypothetical protein
MTVKTGELETEGTAYRMETGDLPPGLYFLVLRGSRVHTTLKVVVGH